MLTHNQSSKKFADQAEANGKLMGGFDLEQSIEKNPEDYKDLFDMMKNGISDPTTGKKRPLTEEEKLKILNAMGQ